MRRAMGELLREVDQGLDILVLTRSKKLTAKKRHEINNVHCKGLVRCVQCAETNKKKTKEIRGDCTVALQYIPHAETIAYKLCVESLLPPPPPQVH